LQATKTKNHRPLDAQRKSKAEKPERAFASLAFLCASMVGDFAFLLMWPVAEWYHPTGEGRM
jgi:hypothetical protein